MYLHFGQNTTLNTKEIIGIFDLDTATLSKRTRDFLSKAEKEGRVINTSSELPKSFVVTDKNVYINQPTAQTLKKRVYGIKQEYGQFRKNSK